MTIKKHPPLASCHTTCIVSNLRNEILSEDLQSWVIYQVLIVCYIWVTDIIIICVCLPVHLSVIYLSTYLPVYPSICLICFVSELQLLDCRSQFSQAAHCLHLTPFLVHCLAHGCPSTRLLTSLGSTFPARHHLSPPTGSSSIQGKN